MMKGSNEYKIRVWCRFWRVPMLFFPIKTGWELCSAPSSPSTFPPAIDFDRLQVAGLYVTPVPPGHATMLHIPCARNLTGGCKASPIHVM